MNSPAIMARRSYLRARCNLVIVHSHRAGSRESTNIAELAAVVRDYFFLCF